MDEKEKQLNLMRYWMFGTYVIIFAATAVYFGGAVGFGLLVLKDMNFWLAFLLAAVFTVLWYHVYKWIINRKYPSE
jgi:hypothetical protein